MVAGPVSGFLDAKGGRMDSVVIERQYSEGAVLEFLFMKKNIFFHDNNSATTASLVKEKTLRAVVDCVICTRETYCLRCSTLLFMFGELVFYVAVFY